MRNVSCDNWSYMKTFKRIQKQVDQRTQFRRPRGQLHVLVHDLLVYCLELKTFHVKHLQTVGTNELLTEAEKELLVAGEQLEERTKSWLAAE